MTGWRRGACCTTIEVDAGNALWWCEAWHERRRDPGVAYGEHRDATVRIQPEKATAAASRIEQFIIRIEDQIGWTTHTRGLSIELPPLISQCADEVINETA